MSENNPSTVQSYVDSATGMAQRAVNSVTGSSNSEVRLCLDQEQKKKNNKTKNSNVDKFLKSH